MAAFFGSPPIFSLPPTIIRTHHISSSSQTPPPTPSPQSQPPTSSPQQLRTTNLNEESVQVSTEAKQQKPIKPVTSSTKVGSTDWIATSLTRRFGIGAGLAWVGFLAFGVISEQIKTRLELSQQEANTRSVFQICFYFFIFFICFILRKLLQLLKPQQIFMTLKYILKRFPWTQNLWMPQVLWQNMPKVHYLVGAPVLIYQQLSCNFLKLLKTVFFFWFL